MHVAQHLDLLGQGASKAVALQLRRTQAEDQRSQLIECLP